MRFETTRWAAAAGLCFAIGCGGPDAPPPAPSGQPMGTAAAPAARPSDPQDPDNAAPVIHSVRLNPRDLVPGATVSALVDASDPDGDAVRLEYEWRVNGRVVETGGRSAFRPADLGKDDRVEVWVTAHDRSSSSDPQRATARVGNRAPDIQGIDIQPADDVRAGELLTASPLARDADGDEIEYEYTWLVNGAERGEGRTFDTARLRKGDRISVRVVASDGGSDSAPLESDALVLGNTPPRITALPRLENVDGEFRYDFEAEDADGDRNLRFWLEDAPDGMTVDPMDGVVTWRPDASKAGVHPVEIGVKDDSGDGTTFVFEVTVSTSLPANADE